MLGITYMNQDENLTFAPSYLKILFCERWGSRGRKAGVNLHADLTSALIKKEYSTPLWIVITSLLCTSSYLKVMFCERWGSRGRRKAGVNLHTKMLIASAHSNPVFVESVIPALCFSLEFQANAKLVWWQKSCFSQPRVFFSTRAWYNYFASLSKHTLGDLLVHWPWDCLSCVETSPYVNCDQDNCYKVLMCMSCNLVRIFFALKGDLQKLDVLHSHNIYRFARYQCDSVFVFRLHRLFNLHFHMFLDILFHHAPKLKITWIPWAPRCHPCLSNVDNSSSRQHACSGWQCCVSTQVAHTCGRPLRACKILG